MTSSPSQSVVLLCSWFCPFAQRAWIALLEKGVNFQYKEVDPYAKGPELMAVNPKGLVPAIKHGEHNIYESLVCVEYVDEAFPSPPHLFPTTPAKRAHARIWIDFISKTFVPTYYRMLCRQDQEEQEAAKKAMSEHVHDFTKAMSSEGPFFLGKHFSAVDIALIPWVQRFYVLKYYRKFEVEPSEPERFTTWVQACLSRPSVSATIADSDKLLHSYARYADNSAATKVAEAINKNTPLP